MELIPILIVTLQRQQQEIEILKEHIGQSTESKYQPLRTATDISTPNEIASGRIKNVQLTLLKPSTYMNLSGTAVRYWMQERCV